MEKGLSVYSGNSQLKMCRKKIHKEMWCRGEVVITAAQLHLVKFELKFCVRSNPTCGESEIYDSENL